MIVRIVKMTFKSEEVEPFLQELGQRKERIRDFEGCNYLQILQDKSDPQIIFSYSYWDNEEVLNKYRYSDFFKETWAYTKARFSAKPEAWSLNLMHELK